MIFGGKEEVQSGEKENKEGKNRLGGCSTVFYDRLPNILLYLSYKNILLRDIRFIMHIDDYTAKQ